MRLGLFSILLAGLVLLVTEPAQAQFGGIEDVTRATGSITIVPPGGSATTSPTVSAQDSGPGIQEDFGRRRIVSIKIKQTINVIGNNPNNQEEPVQNDDGVTFDNLEQTVAANDNVDVGLVNNNGGGGDLSACIATVAMQPSGTAPPDFRFASFDINPNNGSCALVADGSTGSALIVQTPPDGGDVADGVAFPDALVGLFTIIDPAPNSFSGNGVLLTSNVPVTITVRATNGFTAAITLTIIPQGGDNFTLMVTNVVQV